MQELSVERSIWIDAPRERVWNAIADPSELSKWFLPPFLGAQIVRDDKNTLSVSMMGMAVPVASIENITPQSKYTTRSLPDGILPITFELTPEKDGTRVTVKMTGFESLPEPSGRERMAPSAAGWEKGLENLSAYVQGHDLPYPQGFVAALFGYRRQAATKFSLERSIWIDASRERVWQALTDLDQLQQWFSPTTTWRATGSGVGSRFYSPDPETGAERYTQVIDVFDPPNQLVTHSLGVPPEPVQATTYLLRQENGGTRLFLTHDGYEQMPEDVRLTNLENNAFGFGMMMQNIKAFVEGQALPYPQGF